jgi:GntR family transcriptional regulator
MQGQIDPSSDTPIYRQIAAHLREAIRAGELMPGSPLPSESELIAQYGTARGTVRQSLSLLKGEGLIVIAHGRGAFVRDQAPLRRLSHDRSCELTEIRGRAGLSGLKFHELRHTFVDSGSPQLQTPRRSR